ncbi:osmoprotectant transport system permease protein [Gracilibacillus orientalis]|uniref:Osmoprotectant transport system permease protein n=1 Tax=Gracilibacillus orientalis TaxID=334253 RepID=A0A1I4NCD4_9BACI|nr:ABC transporter permease [Gracilibacillus orientalis]SFM13184.1 osmoprotectant transport system permease protein [Gracilibacillus orientalis]
MELLTDYLEFWQDKYDSILTYTMEHLMISFVVMVLSIIVTIPLAIYMTKMKNEKVKGFIFNIANVFQTIPTVALLAIMIPLLGIGFKPAVAALFLYALLPLLRNTYTGIQSIDPSITEAAKGMGFSTFGRLFKVELPAAMPYVMSGIRVTTVYIISWTTLAALIGAGGLGDLILAGIGYNDKQMIFTGTILAIVIALLLDLLFNKFEKNYTKA